MRITATWGPAEIEGRNVNGQTVIVIDCFRASTSIVAALAAGAKAVRPFLEVDDARKAAAAILDAAHIVVPDAAAVPAAVPLKKRHKKKSAKRDERKQTRLITQLQKSGAMIIRATTFRRCVDAAVRAEAPETLRQVHVRLEPASVRLLQHLCERDMGGQLSAVREVLQRAGCKTIMAKFMDTAAAVSDELHGKQ